MLFAGQDFEFALECFSLKKDDDNKKGVKEFYFFFFFFHYFSACSSLFQTRKEKGS